MADVEVKILDIRKFPSSEPSRIGKFDNVCSYQLDQFRTYLVTIPEENFTEEKLKEAIRKDMAERDKYAGKTLKL